ncbi:MAG: LLM class flavin-dependent oxidoreductase [Solimonas sp.]
MSVEFIGFISTQESSEAVAPRGAFVDRHYIATVARAHEYAGFDRALIAYGSVMPDALQVAGFAAAQTQRLKLLIAHRPGFVAPTLAARTLATLDQLSEGRVAVHIISGSDDAEQQRDGDFLDHDQRYARTDEYLEIVKKAWLDDAPFDHDGRFYRVRGHRSAVKPVQAPHLPIYFGGASEAAIDVAGRHADVYALWGESLDQVRETIARVRRSAARYGRERHIRFSLSLRPILAPTEEAAWERAQRTLETARSLVAQSPYFRNRPQQPENTGSRRLLDTAKQGKVVDRRLWTEMAQLTGAAGNSTSLVGTPEQVAEALMAYYDLGVTTFLIRGFDPLPDALQYGRELIPLVRDAVARRVAAAGSRAA